MKKVLFLLVVMLLPMVASADAVQIDGIYYNLNDEDNVAEVTKKNSGFYTGSISIPEKVTYHDVNYSVTSIGDWAFSSCERLTSVTIPNSVTSIGDYAFLRCTGLTSINIPNSVTSIGSLALSGCSGLISITIPHSVTSIGSHAFNGTGWYNYQPDGLVYAGLNLYAYKGTMPANTSITIEQGTVSISQSAFSGCTGLTSITIPNSVTSIGGSAFFGCTGLTSVPIPNSVTSIGESAFYKCTGLTSVPIPNSVTSIGYQAFYGCSGLTSVTIPNSVISIGYRASGNCSGLTSIAVESGNIKYDSRNNCDAIIETASNTLVAGCKNTVIPHSVTSIGDGAFYRCTSLTSVTIPNGVTSISNQAFSGCTGLTSITIPNSVTSIGASAFYGCSSLTTVTIPNSVTSIGDEAFHDCSGLTSVTIGNSVTFIGRSAFGGFSALTAVTVLNPTPVAIEQYVFTNRKNATLYVPEGSKEAYQSADYWKEFKEIEEISIPTHKIIYIVDGEKYKSYDIEEGESITPEPAPTKEGYTFSGWSEIPATMPADDVIVTGTFEVNKYDLTYSVAELQKMKIKEPASEHSLTITAEEGWKVNALTVNGVNKMSSLKDNVLTINISADTEVKVTLGWANEANLYTEDPATSIATIEGEGVKVQAKDGQIWVDGAAGKTVRLYTIGGALMTTVTPTAGNTGKFSVAPGTYIIQVGNKAAKVTVK